MISLQPKPTLVLFVQLNSQNAHLILAPLETRAPKWSVESIWVNSDVIVFTLHLWNLRIFRGCWEDKSGLIMMFDISSD